MTTKRSFGVFTTNFELEPVIDDFLATYPQAQFEGYEVVYRIEDEAHEGTYSYLIVWHNLPTKKRRRDVNFQKFLESHCIRNDKVAKAGVLSSGFPDFDHQSKYTFGRLKTDEEGES